MNGEGQCEGREEERHGWVSLQPGLWIPGGAVRREIAKHCGVAERPDAVQQSQPRSLGSEPDSNQH